MNWLTIKAKLWALAGVLAAAGYAVLRIMYLKAAKERAEHRRDVAEAGLRRKHVTEEHEAEIDRETSDLKREESLDEVPDILRDPDNSR